MPNNEEEAYVRQEAEKYINDPAKIKYVFWFRKPPDCSQYSERKHVEQE
jgi:hypothetical protein